MSARRVSMIIACVFASLVSCAAAADSECRSWVAAQTAAGLPPVAEPNLSDLPRSWEDLAAHALRRIGALPQVHGGRCPSRRCG
ncbi:MAG: hypothetical protein HYV63_22085 [Candidatus Schekmanbacteria bacterium]|nr:hypothetical protein [Candidatus Schekmanbacteria bacterium]